MTAHEGSISTETTLNTHSLWDNDDNYDDDDDDDYDDNIGSI